MELSVAATRPHADEPMLQTSADPRPLPTRSSGIGYPPPRYASIQPLNPSDPAVPRALGHRPDATISGHPGCEHGRLGACGTDVLRSLSGYLYLAAVFRTAVLAIHPAVEPMHSRPP